MAGILPPLAPMVLAFAGGILAGWWAPEACPWVVWVGGLVLGVVAWRQASTGSGGWLLALSWVAGWLHFAWQTQPESPWDLRRQLNSTPCLAALEGALDGAPMLRMRPEEGGRVRWWSRVVLNVNRLELSGGIGTPAVGRVMVSLPGRLPEELTAGCRVRVFGVLRRPAPALAPGLFDWRRHLANRGIHFELFTESLRDWKWEAPAGKQPVWPIRFQRWARTTLGMGLPPPEIDERVGLLWAMVLGWRTGLTDEVAEPFMRTGAMHLFAISGLHVAVIAGALLAGLRVLRLPREVAGWLTVAALWFYAAATGWQTSATRATLMLTVIVGGWALKRPPDLLNSLCAAAFIVLVWDPRQLFQTSFQLSFGVVWFLGLLMPLFEELVRRWTKIDPWLSPELTPRWRRWVHGGLRWVGGGLAVSTAAWLGSWPLVAAHFHLISPVGWWANVVAVPLAAATVVSAVASLACAAWVPWFSECFNHGAWFWVGCLKRFCEAAATWPGAYWHVRGPAGWQIVLWYVAWTAAVRAGLWQKGRRRWLPVVAIGLWAAMVWPAWINRPVFSMTVLPGNGGGAVWADAPGRAADLLVDCGRETVVEGTVLPFLWAQGRNRLPALVLTHGDVEHSGGALLLVREMPVEEVLTSPQRFRSPTYRAFVDRLEKGALPGKPRRRVVVAGDTVAGWRVLHPAVDDRFSLADDAAMVLWGEWGGARVLLLSDLAERGQEALLGRGAAWEADVVVAGIPSRGRPLPLWLVERVRPRWVIWADASVPPAEHASSELQRRLEAVGVRSVSVSEVGAVTLKARGGRFELRSARAGRLDAWSAVTTRPPARLLAAHGEE